MHRGFWAKNREKNGPRPGGRGTDRSAPPSATPEIEPEEAAVVEAASDDEDTRLTGGVVETD